MMKVADLQRFIDGLAQPIKSAGANQKVLDDLARMSQCLEPFKERNIEEFSDFLQTAHNYVTDGTLPAPSRRGAGRGRAGSDGAPRVSIEEAAQRVMDLVERAAAEPNLEQTAIETELRSLEAMTVPQLKQVAEQVHLSVPARPRSKEDMLKAMATAIKERKRTTGAAAGRQPAEGVLPTLNRSGTEHRPEVHAGQEGHGRHSPDHAHAQSHRETGHRETGAGWEEGDDR